MKISFFGYDQSLDIAQRLIADGHEIVGIFTFPCDNVFAFNTHIQDFAHSFEIPCITQRATPEDIEFFTNDMKTELFLICGYPYKIPPIDATRAKGVNMHPALLPRARGIMPLPYIMMHDRAAAGLTLHKLSNRFDQGDILTQAPLELSEKDTIESLNARLAILAPDFVSKAIADLPQLWRDATPQDDRKSSHYPTPDETVRTLDWTQSATDVDLKIRAFGRFGSFATITNNEGKTQNLIVYQGAAWQAPHEYQSGVLIKSSPREVIVTTKDGYACINEFQIIPS